MTPITRCGSSVEFLNSRRLIQHSRRARAGDAERIWPLHLPHSARDELRPRSTGHLAPDLPIKDVTAYEAAARSKEKNHAIEETGQEAQEGQKNEGGKAAQAY
jgi:hypothetical protein